MKTKTVGESVGHMPPARKWGESKLLVANEVFLGLEIELEHLSNFEATVAAKPMQASGLWTITSDNSLRDNGREFIMQEQGSHQPILGNDIIKALTAFQDSMDILEKAKKPAQISDRTSVHVHLDVRDLLEEDIDRLALLYYTFEGILFKWIGQGRDESNYCRSAASNYDIVHRTAGLLSGGGKPFHARVNYGNKYDAFNFAAIKYLGTVEIRSMRATTDSKEILAWINILLRLHEAARDPSISILDFPEMVSQGGMQAFLERIFKEEAELLLPYATDMDILQGLRTAQEILVVSSKKAKGLQEEYDTGKCYDARVNEFKTKVLGE